jgi:hypothetical protein
MWLLQRGCSIQTLDRLFGSTTVGGVLLTNSTLGIPRTRMTYVLITALLCLWTLSPLASQAVLRMISIQPDTETRYLDRNYMNISDWGSLPGIGTDGSLQIIAPNTLINAALIAPLSTKDGPQDLWNNVKIPLLSGLQGNETDDGMARCTTRRLRNILLVDRSTNRDAHHRRTRYFTDLRQHVSHIVVLGP